MDYKKSVNLPRTSFAMKANLTVNEPKLQKNWKTQEIYTRIREACAGKDKKILHDGPPYATGDLHIGTGMNKILKDIIVRYWTMQGFNSPFVPGWDCHGLPIEHRVMKELGQKAHAMPADQIRQKCKRYAQKFVKNNKRDFQTLGVFGDWQEPYLTFNPDYEMGIIDVFVNMFKNGLVYRAKKPIHWCMQCKTALAEAELEYAPETSPSVYVKFQLQDLVGDLFNLEGNPKVSILIWTTTPWTLPANMAIAVSSKARYAAVAWQDEILLMAEDLVTTVMGKVGAEDYKILGVTTGESLQGRKYKHAFLDRVSPIVVADYVTLEDGTGCVHTAPGHGREDYMTGCKYGLEIFCPVDDDGCLTKEAGICQGQQVYAADPDIIEFLRKNGSLFWSEPLSHEYPHCWRCKSPVIFRATPQWFVAMDKPVDKFDGRTLRQQALAEAEKVRFTPEQGKERFIGMLRERPDWCISRQRHWGVPIPAFYCRQCGQEHINVEILEQVRDLFAREGADVWFQKEPAEILGKVHQCEGCGSTDLKKENDIFDVWFESGSSHRSVSMLREELQHPAELYLEGTDQHRGWFQLSMLCSVGAWGITPYRQVVTHGFVVDEEGKKMSKSLGNFIAVEEVCRQYGADIFRLWCSSVDYTSEIRLYREAIERQSDSYRKIRNTFRFLLGNLSDFNPAKHCVSLQNLRPVDGWAISRLYGLLAKVDQMYTNFQLHRVFNEVYRFCVVEMSNFYFMVLKDCLYCEAPDWPSRRSAQTAMSIILDVLVKILAPILVHTCEEVWQAIPYRLEQEKSVHLFCFPKQNENLRNPELEQVYEGFFRARDQIAAEIEKQRNAGLVGSSNMCAVTYSTTDQDLASLLRSFPGVLKENLLVASIEIKDGQDQVTITRSSFDKCVRCWNYSASVGQNQTHPQLCERCTKAIVEYANTTE